MASPSATSAWSVAAHPELTQSPHPVGVLLLHGFTGSPASMVPWGKHLSGLGYAVAVPRLPGHGTSWQELNKCRWADWYGEVPVSYTHLTLPTKA